jgi:hypothetical protein
MLSHYLLHRGTKNVFEFNDDWRNLMNTSKAYFTELKRQTRRIDLKRYSCDFLDDPIFRQRLLSLVDDPSLQISCYFRGLGEFGEFFNATLLCNLRRIRIFNCAARSFSLFSNVEAIELDTYDYLSDFNCFAQVKKELSITISNEEEDESKVPTYDLSCLSPTLETLFLSVKRVVNYHFLTNLRSVEFYGCDSITDVSCFQSAVIAKFTLCPNVTNVNSLVNVKELVLKECDGVTDVSALGRVEKMEISVCDNLINLSGLSTVHSLTISQFPEELFAPLNQNVVLNFCDEFTDSLDSIQFLSTNNRLRELNISGHKNIRDISMLNTVEILNITGCRSITSLTGLTSLKELEMTGVKGIVSGFETFQQLTKLTIGEVNRKEKTIQSLEKAVSLTSLTLDGSNLSFETLVQVEDLTLQRCNSVIEFPSTLTRLQSLEVEYCKKLESFPSFLPSLTVLIICGCNKLPLLKISGEPNNSSTVFNSSSVSDSLPVNFVSVSHCANLRSVQINRRINSLTVKSCQCLKDVSGKEFVRSFTDQHRDIGVRVGGWCK